ncbi:GDP-mannose 4,6-dehydratase [candidate division KSB1 bacterium]|nr:GDP-mannose 4,6-dehydratase [candidate division KSB1 bacterium]
MFKDFFKNKRILVTGVAGVKGSWLALELLEAGSHVFGIDVKSPEPDSNFSASGLGEKISFIQGDVTDLRLVRKILKDVDGIFHLAAVALVGEARRNPLETYRTNTYGVATVLEAVRLSGSVKYAVFITTDKVYKSKGGKVWLETDPLFAASPYPVSKACAEHIIADYYREYLRQAGKRIGIGRAGNVIIGGDFYSSAKTGGSGRIFVDCFDALIKKQSPVIFRPKFSRPYIYGLDILSGYMTLMSQLDRDEVNGEAFNFGPYEQHGIENGLLATKICELWGDGVMWQSGPPRDEPFEKQSLSWEKARKLLSWQPAYSIDEALRDTVRWYRAWSELNKSLNFGKMYDLNRSLISEHRQAALRDGVLWAK